jgi:hypothetical protein
MGDVLSRGFPAASETVQAKGNLATSAALPAFDATLLVSASRKKTWPNSTFCTIERC